MAADPNTPGRVLPERDTYSTFAPHYAGIGFGWYVLENLHHWATDRIMCGRTAAGPYTSKSQAQAEADRRNAEESR